MLGNYLKQTTSADDILRCIFFLVILRVKSYADISSRAKGLIFGPSLNSYFVYPSKGGSVKSEHLLMLTLAFVARQAIGTKISSAGSFYNEKSQ